MKRKLLLIVATLLFVSVVFPTIAEELPIHKDNPTGGGGLHPVNSENPIIADLTDNVLTILSDSELIISVSISGIEYPVSGYEVSIELDDIEGQSIVIVTDENTYYTEL